MVIVNGVVALSIALWAQTIYELSILAWTLLLVGLFVPFAFGMYWKKANSWGAVSSFVGGFAIWLLATSFFFNTGIGGQSTAAVCELAADPGVYSEAWWCALWDAVYIGSFVAFFSAMVLMVVVSLATQKISPPRKLVDYYGEPVDPNLKLNLGFLPLRDAFRKITAEEKEIT